MSNTTAVNFGYPRTLVAETDHWLVLVRPKQPTFGSLVLVCKEPVTAFSDVSPAGFADLQPVIGGIERLLRAAVDYAKINYLMLMMVDPDVHFHVIPRYEGERVHGGQAFPDAGWPGVPALASAVELGDEALLALTATLRDAWSAA
ncbi:HIT family protein [Phenylobacterium sp. LH3H17]|uniref:HIT family protein n=1 Tax=Phenylobacterium sp. LH3H17 TaxID=2903901 RepID=UPI0020C9EF65|nr:HIT family protein [Phenylobacterium sp. LH3H17]UTP38855.1 HIT family protein [Phenylobacterium sp. LH3H17]